MAEESVTPVSESQADPPPAADNHADPPPAWFVEFSDKMSGRLSTLGKDLGRLRERIPRAPAPQTEDAATAAPSAAPTNTVPDAAVHQQILEMATREAQLNDDQRGWLRENTEGLDLSARGTVLDAYLAGLAATAGAPKPPAPSTGRAATAAPRNSAAHPNSRSEFIALHAQAAASGSEGAQARKTLKLLADDPTFQAEF